MTQRINEDIRFYLPADPYYYQVDNLPLEDLLSNDVRLQSQIDEINSSERGNTVGRAGFTELQPFVDAGLPGTISVRPGNFIGRVERTNGGGLYGNNGEVHRIDNGLWDFNNPPTTFGTGDNPTGTYSVNNPPDRPADAANGVARTAVFNFPGGNISLDSFGFADFQGPEGGVTAPLGRLDLIGITTVNGAMDDPYLPTTQLPGVDTGDGQPKLAVVKGAGMVTSDNGRRQVVIGERYVTIGLPQEFINDYGRNLDGDVVPNPTWGTTPAPDDAININYARDIMENGEISQRLWEWAYSNKNASFFLPIAYVYVPQSHVEGNPIPQQYLKDIRPFFRTAELSNAERGAVAASLSPSINNPLVTEDHLNNAIDTQINWNQGDPIQDQVSNLINGVLPNMVTKDFQYRNKYMSVQGESFDWQFVIVNGMWIGHARMAHHNVGGTYSFNLYEYGLDNQNGVQSAIAMGSIYNAGDIEEGNNGFSVGSNYTSNRSSTVFTTAGGLTFKWNLRSVNNDGDRVFVAATVIGKARDGFNLAAAPTS